MFDECVSRNNWLHFQKVKKEKKLLPRPVVWRYIHGLLLYTQPQTEIELLLLQQLHFYRQSCSLKKAFKKLINGSSTSVKTLNDFSSKQQPLTKQRALRFRIFCLLISPNIKYWSQKKIIHMGNSAEWESETCLSLGLTPAETTGGDVPLSPWAQRRRCPGEGLADDSMNVPTEDLPPPMYLVDRYGSWYTSIMLLNRCTSPVAEPDTHLPFIQAQKQTDSVWLIVRGGCQPRIMRSYQGLQKEHIS